MHILPTSQEKTEIILGLDFLQNNDAIINLKDSTLSLDGKFYELPKAETNLHAIDNTIIDKTQILTISENSETEASKAILDYKLHNPKLGTIKGITHEIVITTNEPVCSKPYPVPIARIHDVEDELNKLLRLKVIEPSNSEFCSPAFPVFKKNGKIRLVVDYRKLNSITKPLNYPLTNIQDCLTQLKGSTKFATLDFNMGYYQIKVAQESKRFTSFSINNQQFQFCRMPFGLSNAPRTFQRAVYQIFKDLDFVKVYLDDVLIHSPDIEQHHKNIIEVLKRTKEQGISINFDKSTFSQDKVTFLGHIVDCQGIRPDTSRISSIEEFKPRTKKQVMRILDLIQWFRPFLQNCSLQTKFLSDLTKKDVVFSWNDTLQTKLNAILLQIKDDTLLNYPNPQTPFQLECDAPEIAAGAILRQENKLIGYFSTKFSKSELNYTVVEKETLGVLNALEHFKRIVLFARLVVYTDNANLIFKTPLSRRLQRWKLQMEEFDYELHHAAGVDNKGTDSLSRLYSVEPSNIAYDLNIPEIHTQQQECEYIHHYTTDKGISPLNINGKDILLDEERRILIPPVLANEILIGIHEFLEHPGEKALYNTIKIIFTLKR
eukprot:GAHX01002022.1.p1 GENE.GAHX01002022.1~~GAHX01002022.1.p1  ORF type:complete len:603 (-),score=94.42 GAHX01002022.1:1109-2917(-)